MYSGITSGRVLDGELLYTTILELICLPTDCFIEISLKSTGHIASVRNMSRWLERNLYKTVCRQMQTN